MHFFPVQAPFIRILVRQSTGILICCADELFYLLVLKVLHFTFLCYLRKCGNWWRLTGLLYTPLCFV